MILFEFHYLFVSFNLIYKKNSCRVLMPGHIALDINSGPFLLGEFVSST